VDAAEVEIHVVGFDTKPGPVCVYLPRLPGSELDYDAEIADDVHVYAYATPKGVDIDLSSFGFTERATLSLDYRTLSAPYANTVVFSLPDVTDYTVDLYSPCDAALDPSQSSPPDGGAER
jgi:hypothetical protein